MGGLQLQGKRCYYQLEEHTFSKSSVDWSCGLVFMSGLISSQYAGRSDFHLLRSRCPLMLLAIALLLLLPPGSGQEDPGHSILIRPENVTESDLIIYVSNDQPEEFIPGSLHIPRYEFTEDGFLKSPAKLAMLLGESGVSRNDSAVLYGSCLACGDPTYIFWTLQYLGQERVAVLDGGLSAWKEAGLPLANDSSRRAPAIYEPRIRSDVLAVYDMVSSGEVQTIDARTAEEFGQAHIPGALNLAGTSVLAVEGFKNQTQLSGLFSNLSFQRPVVAYSQNGGAASNLAFALLLMGYDARLYSWQEWQQHHPFWILEIADITASPDPAYPGPVTITVEFEAAQGNESLLRVLGCVTCEPITLYTGGTLNKNKNPGIRLGSYARPGVALNATVDPGSNASAAGPAAADPYPGLVVSVLISEGGASISRVQLQPSGKAEFSGTWNASRAGIYNLTAELEWSGLVRTLDKSKVLEVRPSPPPEPHYKKLGRY